MKTFLLGFLFLTCVFCYDDVYDMEDGNAIMTMNYLLTGILVPWVITLVFCIISCVFCCCVPKKYRQGPNFVAVPNTVVLQQQPMQPMMMMQGGYPAQQMMSPGAGQNMNMAPMMGGEVKQY